MTTRSVQGRLAGSGDVLTVTYDADGIRSVDRRHDPAAGIPILSAGLVDAQVNGFRGFDVNGADTTADTISQITVELASVGVTTWVPTIVTASEESITDALRSVEQARRRDSRVANAVPSVHIEGPFISDRDGARGVHDAEQIRPIDAAEVERWQAAGARVGVVTVSPHQADATAQISAIRALGVTVAIGHSHAAPQQITAAVDAGASLSTHLGNGIESLVKRHPNPIWTQLADDRLSCGLIADGHHLPSDTLEVMLRAKGPNRAFLVSDATALAGNPPGRYRTAVGGVVDLSVDGRLSYVGTEFLAGAAASLADGLRHVLRVTSVGLSQALRLVTENPAAVIPGARSGVGALRVGAPADFVLLTEDCDVLNVIQSGQHIETG